MILLFGEDGQALERLRLDLLQKGQIAQCCHSGYFKDQLEPECEKVILLSDAPRVRAAYESAGVIVEDRSHGEVPDTDPKLTVHQVVALDIPGKGAWMKKKNLLREYGFTGETKAEMMDWVKSLGPD